MTIVPNAPNRVVITDREFVEISDEIKRKLEAGGVDIYSNSQGYQSARDFEANRLLAERGIDLTKPIFSTRTPDGLGTVYSNQKVR